MRQKTINTILKHLKAIKDKKISIKQYEDENNYFNGMIYDYISRVKREHKHNTIEESDYNSIMNLYNSITRQKSSDIKETDNRAKIDIERDENGRISSYGFTIYVKDKSPVVGRLSREEMALIYRLYSSYGSNITQREVSRFFPEYSLCDFKRILRTFSITKASAPFPPHIVEEKSKEELLDMQFREKENDFLRSYEAEKIRQMDSQLKKYMKENADLKDQINSLSNITVEIPEITPAKVTSSVKKDLLIYLSDMHIGAEVGNNSLYNNVYNKEEVNRRLDKVFNTVYNASGYDTIVVCNAGDSLDGAYNQTTRTGHYLPQNMSDKEQIQCFLDCMSTFFSKLLTIPHNTIKYYAVGESNHGGIYEYASQVALSGILSKLGIESTIFDKFLGTFELKGKYYLLSHGKDDKDMFKNWPLVLNDKTEGIINEYLDSVGISNATVIKGDLHQSAITYGKRIKYHSVGSLFGSSGWIMKNFGNTKAACDYSIVEDDKVTDGRVILN